MLGGSILRMHYLLLKKIGFLRNAGSRRGLGKFILAKHEELEEVRICLDSVEVEIRHLSKKNCYSFINSRN